MSSEEADREGMFSRSEYLLIKTLAMSDGDGSGLTDVFMAMEAVHSTALANPEWDMDETKTMAEWEAQR
jgi:hypothetical protein